MAERIYKRLPGRNYGIATITSLWEAPDHLLLVQSYRVSESYRRFFLRDIQALILCRTKTWLMMAAILGFIAIALGAAALLIDSNVGSITAMVFAGLFGVIALFQLLLGPTCQCTLRTAVQTHPLPSLNRLRTARKVLLRLQPKIEAAQATPVATQ